MKDAPRGRLPATVAPLRYTMKLTIDPHQDGLEGESTIRVKIAEETRRIWLHGGDLAIREVSLTPAAGGGPATRLRAANAGAGGVLALTAPKAMPAGEADLHFKWRAKFDTPLLGAYRMEWGGEKYVVTQMEPLGARHAFPCFDEPGFKTPWDLTLVIPEGDVAVANSPALGEEKLAGGRKSVHFATTQPLPTYLIAFGVGPFDVVEWKPVPPTPQRSTPLPLRGIAVRGRGKDFAYALENTAAIVTALEDYFGIAYPFEKLDLLAAPDFGYGAMENAGLITYKDVFILIDDKTPTGLKLAYWGTHAHEVSHMWFGDLVTMPWWDDLWLNESFATWMASKIVGQLHPEFHPERYQMHETVDAMETDDLAATRRIHEPIDDFTEVMSAFDSISYAKGGAVLSMFEAFVGPERFRDAIRAHIRRFAGGSATSADLMRSIAAATDRPDAVVKAFQSFTDQPGVPAVDVRVKCEGGVGQVSLAQKRSLPLGSTVTAAQSWSIPVCLRAGTDTWQERACVLLEQASLAPAVTLDQCPSWVMPNADGAGYYRFVLEPSVRAKLEARFEKLSPVEQLAFAGSLDAAYAAGTLTTAEYLGALPVLAKAGSWEAMAGPFANLAWIREQIATTPDERRKLEAYLQRVYRPLLDRYGYDEKESDDEDARLGRQRLLQFLVMTADDPTVRKELAARAERILGDGSDAAWKPDALGANVRPIALIAYAQEGGAAAQAHLLHRLRATEDRVLRSDLMEALGAIRDPERAARIRALALDPKIHAEELGRLLEDHVRWPENRAATRAWMRANRDALLKRFPATWTPWAAWIYRGGQCSEADAKDFQQVFEKRFANVEGGPRTVAQALEATRLCATLRAHQAPAGLGKLEP
ncbi:MAG: M1 family metallopeptidase [bacterium]